MPKGKKRSGQKIDKITGRFGSSYRKSFVKMAEVMGRAGFLDSEVAEYFQVTDRTIRNWKSTHPEFAAALQIGKDVADARVEKSLYNMANGYNVLAEEIKVVEGKIVRVETFKHIPASPVAALAWLNNRKRNDWQKNPEAAAPEPEVPKEIDITPQNKRDIARRVALTLYRGGKA